MLTGRKLGLRTIWGDRLWTRTVESTMLPWAHSCGAHLTSSFPSNASCPDGSSEERGRFIVLQYLHEPGNGEHRSHQISTHQGERQEGYWSLWVIMRYRLLPTASCGKMAQDPLFFLQRQGGCSICYPDPSLQAWGQSRLRLHSWPWPRQRTLKM